MTSAVVTWTHTIWNLVSRIRIRIAAALYELALLVAPADVATEVQNIVADGIDIGRARLELAGLDQLTSEAR